MIKGENVFLRAMEPSDVDVIYKWENNIEVWSVSNTYMPFSKHFLNEFIAKSNNDLFIDKQLRLIVIENKTNLAVGTLDLFEFDPMNNRVGIGILIDENKREKGYAKETIKLSVKYAFEILNLHQIFCHISKKNKASISLFKDLGFEITGTKKDWLNINNKWQDVVFLQLINK